MLNSLMPLAHITAKLYLDGTEYDLDQYQIGFKQAIDFKGKPQHEVSGGQMSLTIDRIGDPTLYEWGRNSTSLKSGTIVLQTQDTKTVLRISFENAYCVSMTRKTDQKDGTKTVFVISPERVKMNDFEHDNYWPK